MDNKNEKTFADLFSGSTTDNSPKEITFDNLMKSEKHEQTEEKPNITFDNLFEKTEIKEENKEPDTKEDNKDLFHTPPSSIEDVKEESKSTSIFDQAVLEDRNEQSNLAVKSVTDTTNSLNDDLISANSLQGNSDTTIKFENIEENPFFQNASIPQKNLKTEPEKKDPILKEREKLEDKQIELSIRETSPIEINKTKYSTEQSPLQENLFFQEEQPPLENNSIKDNLFFDKKEIKENQEEGKDTIISSTLEEKEEKKEEPKSVSPFFENDLPPQKGEDNPFFLNKINLVENEKKEKKINNIDTEKSKHFHVKIVKKKEPLPKIILGVLSYAVFIWLLLIGITLLIYVLDIKIRAAKGDYSSPTFNAYVVLTGSMLPEIQVYDVVITKKVDASTLNEGDIITFSSADSRFLGTIITHRIIKKNYDSTSKTYNFQTKGDNNNVADSALVPQSNIYGKVILKIPKLGYLQEFLASDGGWIIVILIPCLTVISYDIVKLAKGLKKKKYKNITVQR